MAKDGINIKIGDGKGKNQKPFWTPFFVSGLLAFLLQIAYLNPVFPLDSIPSYFGFFAVWAILFVVIQKILVWIKW